MPRLNCTFAEFIKILESHHFCEIRDPKGSHRRYRGEYGGQVRHVTVAYHKISDDIRLKTLESMIRQSGLPKSLFKK
jgi:predicted RNA binding protein YcfA (HicA-like mRNA interferase family)